MKKLLIISTLLLLFFNIFSQAHHQPKYRVITLQDRGRTIQEAHYNFHTRAIYKKSMRSTYCKFKKQYKKYGNNLVNPAIVFYSCYIPNGCRVIDKAESQFFGRSDYSKECLKIKK